MPAPDLRGLKCLITLSGETAHELGSVIQAHGGDALLLPSIRIEAIAEATQFAPVAAAFTNYSWVIFISPNAVIEGLRWLENRNLLPLLTNTALATVGETSARGLLKQGFSVIYPQNSSGAEALLALPEMAQLQNQRVLIVRGQNGKEDLAEALRARGALVDYLDIYRRICPAKPPASVLAKIFNCEFVIIGSHQGLLNLYHMLAPEGDILLRQMTLLVPSHAAALAAQAHGHKGEINVVTPMNPNHLFNHLVDRFSRRG